MIKVICGEHTKDELKPLYVEDLIDERISHDLRGRDDLGALERISERLAIVTTLYSDLLALLCERGVVSPLELDQLIAHPKLTPIRFEKEVES